MKFLILLFFLISCGGEESKEFSEFEQNAFFDIVYETTHYRAKGTETWIGPIIGDRLMKYEITTELEDEDSIPEDLEGNFVFSLNDYKRNVNQSLCSGGYSGTFTLTFYTESVTTEEESGNFPWNVLDEYEGEGGGSDSNAEISVITYDFALSVDARSFIPTDCEYPFNTHSLKVLRFPNGTLIVDDISKGIEYYMRPKLKEEI